MTTLALGCAPSANPPTSAGDETGEGDDASESEEGSSSSSEGAGASTGDEASAEESSSSSSSGAESESDAGSGEETSTDPDDGTTSTSESSEASETTPTTDTEVAPVTPTDNGDGVTFAGPDHELVIEVAGARVMEYSLGGENVLRTTGERHQQGSTLWVSPQKNWTPTDWPPPATIDDEDYDYEIVGDTAVFTSDDDTNLGVRIEKVFAMDDDGAVRVTYTITALAAVTWAPWEVSRHAMGLCFFAPGDGTNTWEYNNNATPVTPDVAEGIAWIPERTEDGNGELLTDAMGWAGCAFEDSRLLLLKSFPDIAEADFAEGNGDLKIWWQLDEVASPFLELEPIGASTELAEGDDLTYEVEWSLQAIPEDVEISEGSAALVELLPAL